ncbi:MAG: glutamine--tRNA ligase [Deltaproteobacteria bacterium RIFOXYA12_FULL_61_11]|nr:MAG: glutamine--tRNA ligase [Deltaproteobacteria bacterium RIFOXYA12_FULL_61_11]
MNEEDRTKGEDFIRARIREDLAAGKNGGRVVTRFPPEPNGYLHVGHAKSIVLNFGLAEEFGGACYLRFDDTNPCTENVEYSESIKEAVRWLGFDWGPRLTHASDYFEQLYSFAERLIQLGKAYICEQTQEQIREYKGTLTEPGRPSPYRDRPADENLELFRRMRAGEFDEGRYVLRAKIDMASPNLVLRDPVIYRIRKVSHHRTGEAWCIYPMYDFTHCLNDSLEGITHSLCTLEFENNRPLYDWFIDQLGLPHHPQQIEFSRLNLTYMITSKRKLAQLVREGHVSGWDDPRMPTLVGMRRRGFPPGALRDLCERVGLTRKESCIELGLLENCVREALDRTSQRRLAVLRPLKVVLTNWPEARVEQLEAPNHPQNPEAGKRLLSFGRELYIERDDFADPPPKKFHRLSPGAEVRLRSAYIIRCDEVQRDEHGEVVELRCHCDLDSRSGSPGAERKVKGTIHWIHAATARPAVVRLYDRLFTVPDPTADKEVEFLTHLNTASLEVLKNALLEESLGHVEPGTVFQFERLGYFCADRIDHRPEAPVFNRTITLRDTWAKVAQQGL